MDRGTRRAGQEDKQKKTGTIIISNDPGQRQATQHGTTFNLSGTKIRDSVLEFG